MAAISSSWRWPVLCTCAAAAGAGAYYYFYMSSRALAANVGSKFVSPVGSPMKQRGDDDLDSPFAEDDAEDVEAAFEDAAAFVQTYGQNFSSQIKLAFYAYYKQATEGPCTANPPPLYDMVGRAKWNHWRELGSLPRKEAMLQYLFLAQQIIQSIQAGEESQGETSAKGGSAEGESAWGPTQSTLGELSSGEGAAGGVSDVCAAARDGNVATLMELVASGADCNAADESGMTPLMWAADRGQADAAAALIDAGAEVNATDVDGLTALHFAVTCAQEGTARLLVERGARVDAEDSSGDTPASGRPEEWAAWWPDSAEEDQ